MNTLTIDTTFLQPYFEGTKRHKNYYKALDVAFHIQFHFNGYFQKPWMNGDNTSSDNNNITNPYFSRLIDQRRPTESIVIHQYRRNNYSPITKVPCGKVINSLKKIVKCADWDIDYSKSEVPKSLPESDTLYQYCEKVYPKDNSIENWAYKNLIRWLLIDPNALIVVMPMSWDVDPSEYIRPYSFIIESKNVYEYKEGELAVFLSSSESEYMDKNGTMQCGKIIITVTKDCFYEAIQNSENTFDIVEHPHQCGEMPAWLLGGEAKSPDVYQPFYESFIQSMLPSLDDAAINVSDLAAEVNQHVFSTMWYTRMQSCTACQGMGQVLANGKQSVCQTCDGTGGITPSPYKAMEVNLDNAAFQKMNVPIPPAGYIEKNTEMVDKLMQLVDRNIYLALSALNMEFLAQVPLNVSGKAKEVDRDELNNFVYQIAYHMIEEIIMPIYWFINEMRYGIAVPNKAVREKMLPTIPVPQNFEFLSVSDLEDNYIKISEAQVSGEIKDLATIDYLSTKYQDQPEVRKRLVTTHDHNPLSAYAPLELESMLASNMVKQVDVILATYIKGFVNELTCENTDFFDLDFQKQRDILYAMAQAKMDEINASSDNEQEQNIIDDETEVDEDGNPVENVPTELDNTKPGKKQRTKYVNPLENS